MSAGLAEFACPMDHAPHITVLIPTRERADLLVHCLKTVAAQPYERLTILVSDNCSRDHTPQVVEAFGDRRIRYLRTPRRMGMSEHWEWALGHVEPGWVGIVGDDDGLATNCIEHVLPAMTIEGVDAVRTGRALYFWPHSTVSNPTARLTFERGAGRMSVTAAQSILTDALEGRARLRCLPVLYTGGWASTRCIDGARDSEGRFFRSFSPDVYSGIALARVARRVAYVDAPLAIEGQSNGSTGLAHLKRSEPGAAEIIRQFWSESRHHPHGRLPLRRDGTVWNNAYGHHLEAMLQAPHLYPEADRDWERHVELACLAFITSQWTRASQLERLWVEDVARMHGVDHTAARQRAMRRRIAYLLSPRAWRMKVARWSAARQLESPGLRTVEDAAVALAAIGPRLAS